jgi:hypothetical protein
VPLESFRIDIDIIFAARDRTVRENVEPTSPPRSESPPPPPRRVSSGVMGWLLARTSRLAEVPEHPVAGLHRGRTVPAFGGDPQDVAEGIRRVAVLDRRASPEWDVVVVEV